MRRHLSVIIFTLLCVHLSAQDYDIGVRAGINYSTFLGPSEAGVNESFDFSSGFHFGINFQWNFNATFGVRGELMYSQLGSKYTYDDDGYYIFDFMETGSTTERYVVRDKSFQELDISNAVFMIPITGHVSFLEKFEIFGGVYFSTLVSPVALGEWTFGRPEDINVPHNFKQTLDYNYNTDFAGPTGVNLNSRQPIRIIVDGQNVDLPKIPGAYYLLEPSGVGTIADLDTFRPDTKRFKKADYGFIGGFAYYLNKGLFISARLEYGMVDITNTEVDYSLRNVNDDGTLIFNDDFDRNMNVAVSLGFRF